jgi:hypothetical protein
MRGDLVQLRQCVKLGVQVNGARPLSAAAAGGSLDIVRFLVREHGADVNKAYGNDFPPPFVAVQNEHLALVRFLGEELSANVN